VKRRRFHDEEGADTEACMAGTRPWHAPEPPKSCGISAANQPAFVNALTNASG